MALMNWALICSQRRHQTSAKARENGGEQHWCLCALQVEFVRDY
jgi:hypothetical protein